MEDKKEKKKGRLGGTVVANRDGSIFEQFVVVGLPSDYFNVKEAQILYRYPPLLVREPLPTIKINLPPISPTSTPIAAPNFDYNRPKEDESLVKSESDSLREFNPNNSAGIEPVAVVVVPPKKSPPPLSNSIPDPQIIRFCFPKGIDSKTLQQKKTTAEMNNILYGSIDMEKSANSFIFIGSNESVLFYGVCVSAEELLERSGSFLGKQNNPEIYNIKASTITTNRVYCLITRFPFFKAHYSVLYSLLARERLYSIEEASSNSKQSRPRSASDPLALNSENEVISILKSYYKLPVPTQAGQNLTFKLPNGPINLEFKYPKGDEDKLIAGWCIPTCFRILKLETILLLLSACMLEKHVVIVCSNIGVLSNIILSIIPLLRPHVWQGPFIPILPIELQDYLQAPVPFIVGVLSLSKNLEKTLDALVIRIEQQGEIVTVCPGGILPLPQQKQLENNLRPHHSFLMNSTISRFHDAFKTTDKQLEAVGKIMEEIQRFHQRLLDIINPLITPNIDTDSLVIKLSQDQYFRKKEKEFMKEFVSTQMFNLYLEEILSNISEEAEVNLQYSSNLEVQIKQLEMRKSQILARVKYYQLEASEVEYRINTLKDAQSSLQANQRKRRQSALRVISASLDIMRSSLEG